jgi:hypothetical protein
MTTNDLARFADRLSALSDTAWHALDDERADRQLVAELLCRDTRALADAMRAASRDGWCPLCADDTLTPTTPTA